MARPTTLLYRLYEDRLLGELDPTRFPRHLGIILDGHRRYARMEGLPSYTDSYRAGMARFEEFLGWAEELGIENVTGWVKQATGSFEGAMVYMSLSLAAAGFLILTLKRQLPADVEQKHAP